MMKKLGAFVSIVILGALVLFIVQNLKSAEFRFLVWEMETSLSLPVLGAYIVGGLTGRPLWRLLKSQRARAKVERKAVEDAAKKAKKDAEKEAEYAVRR